MWRARNRYETCNRATVQTVKVQLQPCKQQQSNRVDCNRENCKRTIATIKTETMQNRNIATTHTSTVRNIQPILQTETVQPYKTATDVCRYV